MASLTGILTVLKEGTTNCSCLSSDNCPVDLSCESLTTSTGTDENKAERLDERDPTTSTSLIALVKKAVSVGSFSSAGRPAGIMSFFDFDVT